MESRLIINSQLNSSSFKDSTSGPEKARLKENANIQYIRTYRLQRTTCNATMNITMNVTTVDTFYVEHGGWIAADGDNDPWFQVDFRTNVTITALVTQGLDSGIAWVTNYTLAYGQHRHYFEDYRVDGKVKVRLFRYSFLLDIFLFNLKDFYEKCNISKIFTNIIKYGSLKIHGLYLILTIGDSKTLIKHISCTEYINYRKNALSLSLSLFMTGIFRICQW